MRLRSTLNILAGFSLGVVLTLGGLWAAKETLSHAGDDAALARTLRKAGDILPLSDIHDRARAAKAGTVIDTDLEVKRGRLIYEIEILDAQGLVWEIKLDARSGEVLRVELDD